MAFSDTMATINATMGVQRNQMNTACINCLHTLSAALLADHPEIAALYWYQSFADEGFSLTDPGFIPQEFASILVVTDDPDTFTEFGRPLDQGSPELMQFFGFCKSIAYHLYCVHGANVVVMLSASGFKAASV